MKFTNMILIIAALLPLAVRADALDDYISERNDWVKLCLASFDYDAMKLPNAGKAVEQGDYRAALLEVVKYYKGIDRAGYFTYPQVTPIAMNTADGVLTDKLSIMGIDGKFIRGDNGLIDWNSPGLNDNEQWPGLLSRHLYMLDLLAAYNSTSNAAYIDTLNTHLFDFLVQAKSPMKNLQPKEVIWAIAAPETWHKTDESTVISSQPKWYTLNAAIRVDTWLKLFWGMQNIEGFTDDTRAVILVAFFEHCTYVRWHHRDTGNWKVGEMKALAKAAVCFPEFTTSQDWLSYSMNELTKELNLQVYPDGVQKELAASYHRGVLNAYVEIEDIFASSKNTLPPAFAKIIQKMYEYLAFASRNEGYAPVNNDSDNDFVAPLIRKAAEKFKTDELVYVSKFGQKGKWRKPNYGTVFEYAGQAIFRDGYAKSSNWSFFDIGPWGIAHQHNDMLHLSVAVGGRDILVDCGRYTYNGYHDLSDKWRNYFTSSDSHNVILIDGIGQSAYTKENTTPIDADSFFLGDKFSFARGTYDAGYKGLKNKDAGKYVGRASHTRNVLFVPEFGWVVVDTIDTDRPRDVEILWHYHPDCSVEINDKMVFTNDAGKGNLLIQPAQNYDLSLTQIKGQEEPVQGWYSEKFSEKVPSETVIYKGGIDKSATYVWLLIPSQGGSIDFDGVCQYSIDKDIVNLQYSSKNGQLRAIIPIKQGRPRVIYKKNI